MKSNYSAVLLVAIAGFFYGGITSASAYLSVTEATSSLSKIESALLQLRAQLTPAKSREEVGYSPVTAGYKVPQVPFYSQFSDITSPSWQKVGCGIASVGMLIDFYSDTPVSIDYLLDKGISSGAFLSNAGWIHSGLIALTSEYGLKGKSVSLSDLTIDQAFSELESVLSSGPVMASVHYTFEPTNPIPHLVVINGVRDGQVFYNDPAEGQGGGSLSIEKFKKAWKKRYIEIRPV